MFRKVSNDILKRNIDSIGKGDRPYYLKDCVLYKFQDVNFIRILPPVADDDYQKELAVHSWIGAYDGSYLCLRIMRGEICPVCELNKEARLDENEELIKLTAYKRRVIYQILDVSERPQSRGVMVMDAPITLAEEILRQSVNKKTGEIIDISDPEEGREIYFEKIKLKNKQFPEYKGVQVGAVYKIQSSLAKEVKPFDDLLKYPTAKELKEVVAFIRGEKTVVSEDIDSVINNQKKKKFILKRR